jgi:NAD(P)-dependent dehydrogenase (short-subunit alcohol dehydrogenase family)
MSYVAALEGAPRKIRANVIHPGVFWTKMPIDQFGDVDDVQKALATRRSDATVTRAKSRWRWSISRRTSRASSPDLEMTIDGGRGAMTS